MYIKKVDRELINKVSEVCENSPLPKDFNQWLDIYPFRNCHYMFFEIDGVGKNKKYIGHCENCKSQGLLLKAVKNGQYGICPHCHKKVKYRNKKFETFISNREYVWYLTKISKNEFVFRHFFVIKLNNFLDSKYHTYELERCYVVFDNGEFSKTWMRYYNCCWILGYYKNMNYTLPDSSWTYYRNLDLISKDEFKYCQIKRFAKHSIVCPYQYLLSFVRHSQIESLVKNKMFNLANSLVDGYFPYQFVDSKQNDLTRFLCLDKKYFTFARIHNIDISLFEGLHFLQVLKIEPSMQKCLFAFYLGSLIREKERKYLFLKLGFNLIFNYYQTTLKTFENLHDYFDYLENCEKLKCDLSDTKYSKPKNFRVAHDMAHNKVQSIKNAKLYGEVKKQLKKYLKLEFEDKIYSVVMPQKAEDIVYEGLNNANCVGSYLGRIRDCRSIICFVRHTKEKEKSFYTLELDPRDLKVVQCRGYKNSPTVEDSAVQKFVQAWRKKVVLKMLKAG